MTLYHADRVADGIDIFTRSSLPPVNAMFADASGTIGWTVGGPFPRRSGGPHGFRTDGR
ncbi:hypothetical protein F8274_00880 [Micromonospora sp. AMSO31t]|nr:hypothetical protein F8274_00880 [Micromonospora sp. AMSO31t]